MSTEETVDANATPEVEEKEAPAKPEPEQKLKDGEEESSPSPDESGESSDKPKPKGVQKRLDELTRNWRSAERDRDYWREVALQSRQQPQPQPDRAPPEPVKTLKDFDYDETRYSTYVFEKARDEAREAALEAARSETSNWQQNQARANLRQSWESRVAEYAKDHDDFYEVFSDSTPVSEAMAEAIQASDNGPEVAYYLGNNPDIALKLYNLPPFVAAREIGRIEVSLETERAKAKGRKVSGAPAPTPKVEAKDAALSVTASDPDSDKLSTSDWLKRREKEIASKRR